MTMGAREWQFDGLVGPTHNYAGLAYGNVASATHAGSVSNPRKAALQGLEKMRFVQGLGIKQAFLPPHYRPIVSELQRIGFDGGIDSILEMAYRQSPALLASVYSSAFMWVANAGTISPAADTADGKLHITPANLLTNYHRSLEPDFTKTLLQTIFQNPHYFAVHDPLPAATRFSDEGAANHMRVCTGHHNQGMNVFVYGAGGNATQLPSRYPARQYREAFEAVARLHGLDQKNCTLFVQQSPEAIDAGVFHNDVIAMNTTRLMIAHEKAFVDSAAMQAAIEAHPAGEDFSYIEVREQDLAMSEAVRSYFFNSQLLELADGKFVIVAPSECEESAQARGLLESLSGGNGPLAAVHYRDVRESMRNGGGPACLRLRIVLSEEQAAAMHQGIVLTDATYDRLVAWVNRHYRDRLSLEDLRDPAFIPELNEAYAALEEILGMHGLYTSRMR